MNNNFLVSLEELERNILNDPNHLTSFSSTAFKHLKDFNQEGFCFKTFLSDIALVQKNNSQIHHYDKNFTQNIHYTVLRNELFFIDIYCWTMDTEIHNHHFEGAFKQLTGSSMQLRYEFIPSQKLEQELNQGISFGELKKLESQKVFPGDTFEIKNQDQFIHQVIHIDNPVITLCVRTPDRKELGYSTFIYPSLKIDELEISKADLLTLKAINMGLITNTIENNEIKILIEKMELKSVLYILISFDQLKSTFHAQIRSELEEYLENKESNLLKCLKTYKVYLSKMKKLYSEN